MSLSPAPPSLLLSYLRLLRAPNAFTAMADVLLGWLLVTNSLQPAMPLGLLLIASLLLYLAGMVLNDVFDYEVDLVERPQRPLPSGRISRNLAKLLGFQMLALGVVCGWFAGVSAGSHDDFQPALFWRSGAVATTLAVCVLLYDGGVKRTVLGPLVMGSCRLFNILLGMSLAHHLPDRETWQIAGFSSTQWMIAGGIGLYIAGITWFARSEATTSGRLGLLGGLLTMLCGIALAASYVFWPLEGEGLVVESPFVQPAAFAILMAMIGANIAVRGLAAVAEPGPENVQIAVKTSLNSLIILDASLCAAARGPMLAMLILVLIGPTLLLGRWVYST